MRFPVERRRAASLRSSRIVCTGRLLSFVAQRLVVAQALGELDQESAMILRRAG